jgi:hypothetical protein
MKQAINPQTIITLPARCYQRPQLITVNNLLPYHRMRVHLLLPTGAQLLLQLPRLRYSWVEMAPSRLLS